MPKFSAHLGYLFTELPLAERFAAARRAGFTAVEHPNPYDMPAAELRSHLAASGLDLVQIALPAGDAARGEKGLAALPGRDEEFLVGLAVAIEYAVTAGAKFIQVQSGVAPPQMPFELLWESYIENLARTAKLAARAGLEVLIEPIGSGTLAGYFMATTALAIRAFDAVRELNLGLLLDVFHVANAGEDPLSVIAGNVDAIRHLHIADYPGRHQPGTGTLDFASLFAILDEIGYRGTVGCEYKPTGGTIESLGWLDTLLER